MTDTAQLLARLTGFTPGPHYVTGQTVYAIHVDGKKKGTNRSNAYVDNPRTPSEELEANAKLYAAAPDLHRIATAQAAEIERLRTVLELVADGHSKDFTDNYKIARAALAVQP